MARLNKRGGGWIALGLALSLACGAGGAEGSGASRGTTSSNAASVRAGRLGYWKFDRPDWRGEQGQIPLTAQNVRLAPSFDGHAVEFADGETPTLLAYRVREADGSTNVSFGAGSIRLAYRPHWRSTVQRPGHWVRLFEAGPWKLSISPNGGRLVFQTADRAGTVVTNLQVNYRFNQDFFLREQWRWHEIILAYSSASSTLVVDGEIKQDAVTGNWSGLGVSAASLAEAQARGLFIGSDAQGNFNAEGLIDELETFNYPLRPFESQMYRGYTVLSAQTETAPPQVRLSWYYDFDSRRDTYGQGNPLERREAGAPDWRMLGVVSNQLGYVDTNVSVGNVYEYKVGDAMLLTERFAQVPLAARPVESFGRVILLVDQTLARRLASELRRLVEDLAGDGWQVVRHDAPRHNDENWRANPEHITRLKALIAADYQAAPAETKAVFIVGHVVIPFSGDAAEDGHDESRGAWPADSYYGDVDGVWTDHLAQFSQSGALRENVPGDGKFDQDYFPTNRAGQRGLELAVGRVDFSHLPLFNRQSEEDLLRRYLDKDHQHRRQPNRLPPSVLAGAYFGLAWHPYALCTYYNALRAATAWGGLDRLEFGDLFAPTNAASIGLQAGYGVPAAINNAAAPFLAAMGTRLHTTADLTAPALEPKVEMYVLAGSFFINWSLENNLMRAALATPNYGLLALPGWGVNWRFDPLAAGQPVGACMVLTSRGAVGHHAKEPIGYHSVRLLAMLGDPTLRLAVSAPPTDLTGRPRDGSIALAWSHAPMSPTLYYVFRSTNGLAGPFQRLTAAPLAQNRFIDAAPPAGAKTYAVRSLELVVTPTGSFTNLSQAVFATVPGAAR